MDVLLPVEDLFFNEVVVEWEVVEMPIKNWRINDLAHFLMNKFHFLLLRAQLEQIYHVYGRVVHSPLHNHIILFNRWVHEVTCEVEN